MKTNKIKYLLLVLFTMVSTFAMAQGTRVSGTVSDAMGPIMGANVTERDASQRIISAVTTDINGNFSMEIKNTNNKLQISYVGCKTQKLPIGARTTFDIVLEDQNVIKEVVIKAKRKFNNGGLSIPENEVSMATQNFNMDEVEGLSFTSADEALQGQIAGLDIVANSGNLGSGTSMRLRGVTSINGSAEPLIVVDDQIFDNPDANFDFTNANEETYASLLSVNPSDIQSIDILKDAAATAVWGSRGANGVISIHTKRGSRGNTRVDYSLRVQTSWQPKGYNLLNGDDYTMMLKEMYYNPSQNPSATTNINEINYNRSWAEFENWNNNTDWVDAVQQTGISQYHYLTISGGGEKANFRISAGYDHQNGTIIEQTLDRFSTKLALDYFVSDRITFRVTFPLTYTDNHRNYDDNILGRAQKMSPNMSIYRQDAQGNDTNEFYTMLPGVPMALAHLWLVLLLTSCVLSVAWVTLLPSLARHGAMRRPIVSLLSSVSTTTSSVPTTLRRVCVTPVRFTWISTLQARLSTGLDRSSFLRLFPTRLGLTAATTVPMRAISTH